MSSIPVMPHYWPNLAGKTDPAVDQAVRLLFTSQQQHEAAFVSLKAQLTAMQAKQTTVAAAAPVASSSSSTATATLPSLGTVNNQTGTSYMVQDVDYGGLITLNNTAPVAVTLNSAVRQYWFASIQDIGSGNVTISPQQGMVNGYASIGLTQNMGAILYFDGANWWAMTVPTQPITVAPTAKMFLTGYSSTNGQFSEAQPAFTDVSGNLAISQLPTSGVSGTVKLAPLTATGGQGAIIVQNGLITSFTNPT